MKQTQANQKIQVVKVVEEELLGVEQLPVTFNRCDHIVIDMPDNAMGTVVLNTPYGLITLCSIPFNMKGTGCLDIKLHSPGKETTLIGFSEGKEERISKHNLYTLDVKPKSPL